MTEKTVDMIDAVFDISGEVVPTAYAYPLWKALTQHLSALEEHDNVGVLPLRTSSTAGGLVLPRRTKLVVRIPRQLETHIDTLAGKSLSVDNVPLQLGAIKLRPIQPSPTLHAHLVIGDADETAFLHAVTTQLAEMNIPSKLICGLRSQLSIPERTIHGYSLVIHDMKPDASLRLQYAGLGAERRYGCGIFVPYKAITDLE
ncbi:MAG: type I-MYXAN CRISPR-associated protein Cas6/Cmx6 [Sideroxydans sp.]|nr:type I-MYXAN CRISPR-associated protein Cas6/Cmx6 [Sideroxydans sp.]